MEKIKLVIWDLDETFWHGTLSEEGITPILANIELVKELSKRGIINSIVSKNNFDQAKEKLEELGIWDYFVFPQIDWAPKGALVKKLIVQAQLRAVNCLFLDDNYLNLEEVLFYNKDINAKGPEFIPEILAHRGIQGKNDEALERLNHYKILEKKSSDSENFSDNSQFLKQSEIKVHIGSDVENHFDRIAELIERTNQLNYTKLRINKDELKEYSNNVDYSQGYVEVSDRYGYYGVVGYYCLDTKINKLVHFVFSCRTLNLGVEQFTYYKLNFPELEVLGDVATLLDNSIPDWISETDGLRNQKSTQKGDKIKVILRGGCDLRQMLHYFSDFNIDFIEETNGVSPKNIPIHAEHSQYLADIIRLDNDVRDRIIDNVPFVFHDNYQTQIYNKDIDVVIYSVLMDYTQIRYFNTNEQYIVCHGGTNENWMDESQVEGITKKYAKIGAAEINEKNLESFRNEHQNLGKITPNEFLENLKLIRAHSEAKIIFINGSEIDPQGDELSIARHKEMNEVLDQFINDSENCYLLDIRKFVKSQSDMTDHIRHYKRSIYENLANELIAILVKIGYNFDDQKVKLSLLRRAFNSINGKRIKKVRRALRRLFK